jgi:hypothetical protein
MFFGISVMIVVILSALFSIAFPFYLMYILIRKLGQEKGEEYRVNWSYIIIGSISALIFCCLIFPHFMAKRRCGQYTQCQSNLKNIGTALEMFSTDNEGRYPSSLKELAPNYLKQIPTCASAGKDTYSNSYSMSFDPDNYTFFCSGANHLRTEHNVPPNYPQYNSREGLIRGGK